MTQLQQYQLWIGLGIALLIITFLIVVFFVFPNLSRDRLRILKILVPYGAGAAGALITGEAVISYTQTLAGAQFAISGTAGVALFILTYLKNPVDLGPEPIPDGFNANIPENSTFRDTVDTFAGSRKSVAEYQGFTGQELSAPLRSQEISAKTMIDAMINLRLMTVQPDAIRRYDVSRGDSVYRLRVQ